MNRGAFTLIEALVGAVLVGMLGVATAHSLTLVRAASHRASAESVLANRSLPKAAKLAERSASDIRAGTSLSHGREIALQPSSFRSFASGFGGVHELWTTSWIVAEHEGICTARWVAVQTETRR